MRGAASMQEFQATAPSRSRHQGLSIFGAATARERLPQPPTKLQAPRVLKRGVWVFAVVLGLLGQPVLADEEKLAPDEGDLRIVRLDLLDAPGGYAIPADSVFYPGEKLYLGFNLAGYTVNEEFRIHLTWRADAVGPNGVAFAPSEGGEFAVELAPQDENWEPYIEIAKELPPFAGSGSYALKLQVEDVLAGEKLSRDVVVQVQGEDVEVSDALSVRNLRFALSEGGTPLEQAVIGPGDRLHASFYISGYKTGDDNRYDVESEMRVINSKGETMIDFSAQGEKGAPFYPRLWLPAKLRLDLDRTIPVGHYVIVLEVRDKVGGLTLQVEEKFEVR